LGSNWAGAANGPTAMPVAFNAFIVWLLSAEIEYRWVVGVSQAARQRHATAARLISLQFMVTSGLAVDCSARPEPAEKSLRSPASFKR
jgi:hypothetical protein